MFIATLLISVSSMLSAQLTYGTTGLLHAPSAEMQKDKTVMLGGNFMNKEITPSYVVLPYVQLFFECYHFAVDGSCLYLHPV